MSDIQDIADQMDDDEDEFAYPDEWHDVPGSCIRCGKESIVSRPGLRGLAGGGRGPANTEYKCWRCEKYWYKYETE